MKGNKLTALPAGFNELKNINNLNLKRNSLSVVPQLPNMKYMVADGNSLFGMSHQRKTATQVAILLASTMFAYIDLCTDLYTAKTFWDNGNHNFAVAQGLFIMVPVVITAVGVQVEHRPWNMNYTSMSDIVLDIFERLSTLLHLRAAIECVRTILVGAETPTYAVIKLLEALFESGPSAILQIYMILTSSGDTNYIIVISSIVSLLAISDVLFRMYAPDNSSDKNPIQVSCTMRFLFHFCEIAFRVFTAVGVFIAVTKYGFALIAASIALRIFIGMKVSHEPLNVPRSAVTAITLAGLKSGLDYREWLGSNVLFCFIMNTCDAIIAIGLLLSAEQEDEDSSNYGVSNVRKEFVCWVLLATFVMQVLFIADRYNFFVVNPLVAGQEENILKLLMSMAWLVECLVPYLEESGLTKKRVKKKKRGRDNRRGGSSSTDIEDGRVAEGPEEGGKRQVEASETDIGVQMVESIKGIEFNFGVSAPRQQGDKPVEPVGGCSSWT